jgi:antitoxin YefM
MKEEKAMPIQTTYTHARANLSKLFNEVTENREVVIIRRRNGEDVAVVAADELASITETAHLLRSPKNARRLLQSLARALSRTEKPQTLQALREVIGLGEKT